MGLESTGGYAFPSERRDFTTIEDFQGIDAPEYLPGGSAMKYGSELVPEFVAGTLVSRGGGRY